MININKRAQKELYAKVEHQAHLLRGSPREYQALTGLCPVNVIEMHAQKIQALLDELEAKDKSIDFLKEQLDQLANFNPDWDKLEAATDSIREHIAKLSLAEKRIAELEAKLDIADKLQDSAFRHGLQHGFSSGQTDNQAGFEECLSSYGTGKG